MIANLPDDWRDQLAATINRASGPRLVADPAELIASWLMPGGVWALWHEQPHYDWEEPQLVGIFMSEATAEALWPMLGTLEGWAYRVEEVAVDYPYWLDLVAAGVSDWTVRLEADGETVRNVFRGTGAADDLERARELAWREGRDDRGGWWSATVTVRDQETAIDTVRAAVAARRSEEEG